MNLCKKILRNSFFLKICSCIIGFSCWYIISNLHTITIEQTIPVTFYGQQSDNYSLQAQESVIVTLQGKKKDLYNLDLQSLALHINADELHQGKNCIILSEQNLFLPHEIKLVHYIPSHVVVRVKKS